MGKVKLDFSLSGEIKKDDPRQEIWKKQREERGFDDTELWNLDATIAEFILPRLKRFRDIVVGYPGNLNSQDEWYAILDKMIKALEITTSNMKLLSNKDHDSQEEGLKLFAEYFNHLWW